MTNMIQPMTAPLPMQQMLPQQGMPMYGAAPVPQYAQQMPQGLPGGYPQQLPQGMPGGYPQQLPQGMPGGYPQQMMQQGMPGPYTQQLPAMPPGQPVYVNSMAQVPPGAVPVPQSQGAPSPIKSVMKFAALGAGAGAAFGIIPFLPLGPITGAVVGAGVGATLGLVRGIKAKRAASEQSAQQQELNRQAEAAGRIIPTPGSVPPAGPPTAQAPPAAPSKGVVMSPAMRQKWAAKVAAERAAGAGE